MKKKLIAALNEKARAIERLAEGEAQTAQAQRRPHAAGLHHDLRHRLGDEPAAHLPDRQLPGVGARLPRLRRRLLVARAGAGRARQPQGFRRGLPERGARLAQPEIRLGVPDESAPIAWPRARVHAVRRARRTFRGTRPVLLPGLRDHPGDRRRFGCDRRGHSDQGRHARGGAHGRPEDPVCRRQPPPRAQGGSGRQPGRGHGGRQQRRLGAPHVRLRRRSRRQDRLRRIHVAPDGPRRSGDRQAGRGAVRPRHGKAAAQRRSAVGCRAPRERQGRRDALRVRQGPLPDRHVGRRSQARGDRADVRQGDEHPAVLGLRVRQRRRGEHELLHGEVHGPAARRPAQRRRSTTSC